MKNICFLLAGFTENGGIGRVTSILVNELCKNESYQITTLSYSYREKENLYSLDSRINQCFLFDKHMSMKKALLSGGVFQLRKFLRDHHIDVLISCGALFYPLATMATFMNKTKSICWEHSNLLTTDDHHFQSFSRKVGVKFADRYVVLTKTDFKMIYDKYRPNNLLQIYNPVDPKMKANDAPYDVESKKIISVGRLNKAKNYSEMIDIAEIVLDEFPDWSWDVYGEGELREQLEKKVEVMKHKSRFKLMGQVNDIYSRYSDYSFLVMTSIREGFPMTLIEASTSRLPLVSYDILTGPNEIIVEGKNGYLIDVFNEDEMVKKIKGMILNHENRILMSECSYRESQEFSIHAIAKKWTELIEDFRVE